MVEPNDSSKEQTLRVRIREFDIPPIRDAVLIGSRSPIGIEAMQTALRFLCSESFHAVPFPESDLIECILVRNSIMRKISEEQVRTFVYKHIEEIMNESEILLLEMQFEFVVEANV